MASSKKRAPRMGPRTVKREAARDDGRPWDPVPDTRNDERSKRGRPAMRSSNLNRIGGAETLNERAYVELRNAIMAARLQPGEEISLRGLAKALGTSAQPIRDAVKRLMSESALEALPNRTVRVPHLTRERFVALCRLRVLLEGEAAASAAPLIRRSEIARLERLNSQIRTALAARDLLSVFSENQEFHFTVYRAAENPLLLSLIENLWLLAGPYLTVPLRHYQQEGIIHKQQDGIYKRISVAHHESLISGLRNHKPVLARQAIEADIRLTEDVVIAIGGFPDDATRLERSA